MSSSFFFTRLEDKHCLVRVPPYFTIHHNIQCRNQNGKIGKLDPDRNEYVVSDGEKKCSLGLTGMQIFYLLNSSWQMARFSETIRETKIKQRLEPRRERESLFAIAKNQRIRHDHQAPFLPWPRSKRSTMTFFLELDFKRWHEAKTSCHMVNIPWTPKILTYS